MVLRFIVIVALALAATKLVDISMNLVEHLPEAGQDQMQTAILLTALIVYALLIAIPFVPGVEIGIALLILHGAPIAPAIYIATIAGLLLAYWIGRLAPKAPLERGFRDFRLNRAADLIARNADLTPQARELALMRRLPRWLRAPLTRYRYVSLALLINLPGNTFLGGGGGLLMAAGLSRLFCPRPIVLTLLLAVLPAPFSIWWFGTEMFSLSAG